MFFQTKGNLHFDDQVKQSDAGGPRKVHVKTTKGKDWIAGSKDGSPKRDGVGTFESS